jgi:hypothetical protein
MTEALRKFLINPPPLEQKLAMIAESEMAGLPGTTG